MKVVERKTGEPIYVIEFTESELKVILAAIGRTSDLEAPRDNIGYYLYENIAEELRIY